ncbi:hypothetical protein QMK33_06700 [Hymenobacter sp. H14-R3]|uniref:hypothetical protein n=1 Tax=Hymenobacter sp. H14-R3 TaxID=3046308 RepID=UPI0024BBC3C4|nr:hypothetical protein [Hymenobacter sp. H14-R3]MDJ0364836.1 hypothetical protein [Hymenobacter sp. H14-R3]
MKLLKEKFLNKDALYPTSYKEFILRLTRVADVSKSSGSDEEKAERGKAFGSVYECFMYATMLGIKAQYPLPFERGAAGTKFLQTKFWKPDNLVEYIFISLLALADFPFSEIENLTEEEADTKALDLTKSMEFYAKGGFELMATKSKESPHYFENAGNIVSFLQTMKPLAS